MGPNKPINRKVRSRLRRLRSPGYGQLGPTEAGRRLQQSTTPKDMASPEFVTASLQEHRSDLLTLNVAYMSWVFAEVDKFFGVRCADVVGMEAPDYGDSILDKLCASAPPQGIFYLVNADEILTRFAAGSPK